MIRQVFEGATMKQAPKGIFNNPQSRAMYAIDLMLDWHEINEEKTIEPMICEINFIPDCTRACKYHPSFFNDVFNTLFLDSHENSNVTKIC
jgi:tubulin--tyrosine ligase-like protein 12